MPKTSNGNGGLWKMFLVLFGVGSAIVGWTVTHHESDMVRVGQAVGKNAEHIKVVAERTVRLDANLANLTSNVTEIKEGIEKILDRLPGRTK